MSDLIHSCVELGFCVYSILSVSFSSSLLALFLVKGIFMYLLLPKNLSAQSLSPLVYLTSS